jgi:hypothetical protein
MGRYYTGDIEGKFWFGVQNSNDADCFGSTGYAPALLEYYFEEDGIGAIDDGIAQCLNVLGDNKSKLDAYFARQEPWNDETVSKATGMPVKKVGELLVWYARLELGQKILDCVKKNGSCQFQAEL